ncbi:bifunctional 2-polyprenyl-6-hydroxyphenol methylase/3-demethylubiquinol 3-O-methyltransferase UbiG [Sphingorhabdus soli]|uniref:Ubiquinone biosynthesis O-methyltransferase n=1 Tax=Flavisphingopyxis soli TaxID=2601267 RepID=A0A5C6ULS1_9SPHN|nr:bifunctional 2-polyprenyl-6-hydroxyphenol methylase/3-demethylubiquinol 3-O-methyltransferase UbiG [Sphingorhabdus soli]TXC74063.1 bifunctional 2-polyprenyl-6-hydroxyphenol methylase/3-demethylubiquinol 3-O-methyltransferase UbiG [Sphingorhabdus soli]
MTSIVPAEAEHFGSLAADWWDPKGSSAMLHRLNPVRLRYIREAIDHHWGIDDTERHPLAGRSALDVGCGAGLLAEPLARLGASVTGVDAAPENIDAARVHAAGQGLTIDYRSGDLASLNLRRFDLVTSMEVIEHVADPAAFVQALADRLAPGGLMVLSTPNRTTASKLLLVEAAERLGQVPRGTHDWDKFVRPEELTAMLEDAGLIVGDLRGLVPMPGRGFVLGDNHAINYLLTARYR